MSSLPLYQRSSAKAFVHDPVIVSITHGEAMTPQFEQGFYDAVAAYSQSRDVDAFNQALRDATSEVQPPAH